MRFLVTFLLAGCLLPGQDFDLLLTGGRVVDGSGNPWYRADIGIRNGRIAEIGRLANRKAKRTIAVNGQVIAPGFVDMMGATSLPLLLEPASAESKDALSGKCRYNAVALTPTLRAISRSDSASASRS